MKRLANHLIGVDQGTRILFSDFDNDGPMWSGTGARERRVDVEFSRKFKRLPVVHVSIDMFDMDKGANQRADISTDNVTKEGFEIVFRTWGDTRIARVRAGWLAIGELRGEDEWVLD